MNYYLNPADGAYPAPSEQYSPQYTNGSSSMSYEMARQPLANITNGMQAPAPAPNSKKRKAAEEPEDLSYLSIPLPYNTVVDKSPAQIRQKIRRFLDNGGMKVGEFCNVLGVSNVSYNRFMQAGGGSKGSQSDTYHQAFGFFKRREMAGLSMPTKKRSRTDNGTTLKPGIDLSGIHLDGEEEDKVPIYETCDEVRKKISNYLRRSDVTTAAFLRDAWSQLQGPRKTSRVFQGKQLSDFRSYKGPTTGNSSALYYGAYVLFEKLRIKEGKEKSNHRLEMEKIWPYGFETERQRGGFITMHESEVLNIDEYGRMSFSQAPQWTGTMP